METGAKRPYVFFLVGVVLISFSPIFVKLSAVPAVVSGFYRHLFGLMFLLPWVLLRKERWFNGRWTILFALLSGVLFFVDLWSWHVAIGYIGPGLATLIGNFQVFFVAIFSVIFLQERPVFRFWLAIPLALAGVYLIGQSTNQSHSHQLTGVVLCLIAAFCYAIFLMVNRRSQSMTNKISAEMNLVYITLCGVLFFGLTMEIRGESFELHSTRSFWALLAYGGLPHFLGWIILIRCLPLIPATVAGITLLVQPVLTFIWEVLIFSRQFTTIQLIGGLLAIVAVYMGTAKRRAKTG